MDGDLLVLLVSENSQLIKYAEKVVKDLTQGFTDASNILYSQALSKGQRLLSEQKTTFKLELIVAPNYSIALEKIMDHSDATLGIVWFDHHQKPIDNFLPIAAKRITSRITSYSLTNFIDKQEFINRNWQIHSKTIERVLTDDPEVLKVELLCRLMDYLDSSYFNRFALRAARQKSRPAALGMALLELMAQEHKPWILSYYTGSVVSSIIKTLEERAADFNGTSIRGPSEHALACGALANYLLFDSPFLIVVTCGMMDEFKGTLANLKQAKARGIIVCANNRAEQWHAFQGGISNDEDIRQVLAAKRIPYLCLEATSDIQAQLLKCQSLLRDAQGPVVLLVEPQLLESVQSANFSFSSNLSPPPKLLSSPMSSNIERVLDIINNQPVRLLWQCNRLSQDERAQIYEIASEAGIGLCDSLVYPGSVCELNAPKNHFLGTLGIYGTSPKINRFLHEEEKLRPKEAQWVFFLKSKVAQVDSPFSESERKHLQIVQVDQDARHLSPFTDIGLSISLGQFLSAIKAGLRVNADVLAKRQAYLQEAQNGRTDILRHHAIAPLSPNYFLNELDAVISDAIENNQYRYTGVYDVGRFGMSAIRDVTKTDAGFSGWYGKALMGDAYLATLSLIFSNKVNILAFVGDGAKNMVPSIESSIIEQLTQRINLNKNVTIFFGMNATTSLIESYQDRVRFERNSRQMQVVNALNHDREYEFSGVTFRHITLREFDSKQVKSLITAPQTVNFVNVVLSHNSEAAGISNQSYLEWQTKY